MNFSKRTLREQIYLASPNAVIQEPGTGVQLSDTRIDIDGELGGDAVFYD